MMNADPRNPHRGGEWRVKAHWLGIATIAMRMGFFQFGPVFDEIGATHRLFSLRTRKMITGYREFDETPSFAARALIDSHVRPVLPASIQCATPYPLQRRQYRRDLCQLCA